MIDLGRENQLEEWNKLQEYFKNTDVYIYLKSQDLYHHNLQDFHKTYKTIPNMNRDSPKMEY
jgi:hypothetical protein